MTEEKRFRRLLRWYPRAWRKRNGEVLLGTMLDDADARGRASPSPAVRMSALGYGLGTRVDGRFAITAALLSLATGVLGSVLQFWVLPSLGEARAWWVPALNAGISPALIAVGLVSIVRQRGGISEPRAVGVVALAVLAFAASALAQISWNEGFDEAERGVAQSGFAAAWWWLFACGLALGTAAIALFGQALLRLARLGSATSILLASLLGLLLAPVIGFALLTPFSLMMGAVVLTFAAILLGPQRSLQDPARRSPAGAAGKAAPALTIFARALASVTAVASAAAIAFALTGSLWPGNPDATKAMRLGIAIAMFSALPLIVGIGVSAAARRRSAKVHTWVPLALIALACVAVAVSYLGSPEWTNTLLGFAIAGVLGGAALGWWLYRRIPGTTGIRTLSAVLISLSAATVLSFTTPMLAFGLPVLAVLFVALAGNAARAQRGTGSLSATEVNCSLATPAAECNLLP